MDQWKLWLLLLLPLCWCLDSQATVAKSVGKGPDVTPICTNKPQSTFTVECKISTEKTNDEKCLLYQHAWGVVKQCDPRFTLTAQDQTVFLNLTSLTPVDSGNYTCVCSRPEETYILHLNITVEDVYEVEYSSGSSGKVASIVVGVVFALIIVAGLVLGFILREEDWRQLISRLSRDCMTSEAPDCEAPCSLDKDDPDHDYKSLRHPAEDLYENMSTIYQQDRAKRHLAGNNKTVTFLDTYEVADPNEEIYENV